MTITSSMAKMTIRSTFALDPETVARLDRLAERWQLSKSAALRRIVRTAAAVDELDSAADAIAALDELHESSTLSAEEAEEWVRRLRAERAAGGP